MLSLSTLGRLALELDGRAVPGSESRRRELSILAILATEETVSRDRLMALLWPDSDTPRARASLKQALHHLRHVLGGPELVQGSVMLRLNPSAIQTDVGRFRAAVEAGDHAAAVALYAGPFLEGVHLGGSAELDEWVAGRRADLARRWAGAVGRLAAAAEERGDPRAAAEQWERLQAADPTDSQVTLRLMQALEAEGRRAAALQQARDHQKRLQEEWDLPPDPAVADLAERLQAASPRLESRPDSPYRKAATGPSGGSSPVPSTAEPVSRSGPDGGAPPSRSSRRVPIAVAALLLLAFAVGALRSLQPGRDPPGEAGDPDLVAVAPFQVLDPTLELWHEGLADLLVRDLDGAGPLRTVPAMAAFRAWPGGADRTSADSLGRLTGAALVVFGSVARLDADSVALRASVLDRSNGRLVGELEVRGPERYFGPLADSLVVGILRTVGRGRAIGAVRRVSLAARSLPALREFLRGEQHFRRGAWDSALVHYDRAVAQDPEFGLALRRMYQALAWGAVTSASYRPLMEYRRRALALNRGLSPRDSLLILADSIRLSVLETTDPVERIRRGAGALAVLEEAARRYPDDVEAWYEIGEIHVHELPPVGGDAARGLAAFARAIELDPGFAPPYSHAVELAHRRHRPGDAGRYARAGAAITRGSWNSTLSLAASAPGLGRTAPTVATRLEGLSRNGLSDLAGLLRWATDSAGVAVEALHELYRRPADGVNRGSALTDSLTLSRRLARELAFRGRLDEAAVLAGDRARPRRGAVAFPLLDPFLELALLGAVPDSLAREEFAGGLAPDSEWGGRPNLAVPRGLRGAPWWLARRDTVSLRRLAERAAQAARDTAPVARFRGRYLGATAEAYLALTRGDSAEAARRLRAIPDTLCSVMPCLHEKLTLARLLASRGEDREALGLLDRWVTYWDNTPSAVLAVLETARITRRLGDSAAARARYEFVSRVWQEADPRLQQHVTEARAALAGLEGTR